MHLLVEKPDKMVFGEVTDGGQLINIYLFVQGSYGYGEGILILALQGVLFLYVAGARNRENNTLTMPRVSISFARGLFFCKAMFWASVEESL